MYFAKLAIFALPFLGAFASPTPKASLEKRDSIVNMINNFQTDIEGPIALINAGNNDKTLTADNLQIYLSDILTSINIANQAIGVNARGLPGLIETVKLEARQNDTEDDLKEVGAVLAKVITDLVEALDGIVDDLRFLPLIGALIESIDVGLNTLLLGVEIVLTGVIQILQGLLAGLQGLLDSLGLGLLLGLLTS